VRTALYVGAIVIGVIIAQLGSEPVWIVAVAALLAFPLAAAAVVSATPAGGSRRAPVGTGLLTGLSGGILAGLLVRLAVAAPGWENATNADCGGASTATQQIVLWGAAVVFVLALLPVGMTLAGIGIRVGSGRAGLAPKVPLSLYPLAVAASGLALIGAGFATNC
jgi:hypothetical protein